MENVYAGLQDRIKAAVADGILLIVIMYSITEILKFFNDVPSLLRMSLFILFFFLYEPLMVSIFGFTAGHYYFDIKVKRENNHDKNISFPLAVLRFILKFFLGWVSLLSVTGTDKKQAIHDKIASSVVLID
ncbi:RDD family protein [Winogradskyella endarachnes]|uniref:RDD family protein n=1 Tax=Winogradskyella endarachnes TaxID=2681965 RepID=A0A6L6UC50_9FLAO|nr:RDD family protein [Winogradskyella endarachnes]MUU79096.1 RDD family protein [Winogradskyella endarachnes]